MIGAILAFVGINALSEKYYPKLNRTEMNVVDAVVHPVRTARNIKYRL